MKNLIGLLAAIVGWVMLFQAEAATLTAQASVPKVKSKPKPSTPTPTVKRIDKASSTAWRNETQGSKKRDKRATPQSGATMTGYDIVWKIMMNYKKEDPPMLNNATEVKIGVYIISVYAISEQTMDYQVSMYLRQAWMDPRLSFKELGNKIVEMRLGDKSWDKIWIPDTFLRNEKGASFHSVTVDNRLLRLSADGSLWYVTKISAVLSCPMNLIKFPMDTQVCPMAFESFGYTQDTVYFKPMNKDVYSTIEIADDLQMPQFTLAERRLYDCSKTYASGVYPCMEMQFKLRRDIGYFLIQVYVPSVLIVILSWVSFWINVDASPARVSLGLLTVLTTTTMSSGARSSLPRVSYIKAIDVWMIVCLIFVFTSLIEYAVVNVLARHIARPSHKKQARNEAGLSTRSRKNGDGASGSGRERRKADGCFRRSGGFAVECDTSGYGRFKSNTMNSAGAPLEMPPSIQPPPSCSKAAPPSCAPPQPAAAAPAAATGPSAGPAPGGGAPAAPVKDGKYRARMVDKLSRKCFPLAFTVFNIIYWLYYNYSADHVH